MGAQLEPAKSHFCASSSWACLGNFQDENSLNVGEKMKAMILAAGLGKRMRPLTDSTPKPLLEVAGKPLIVHQIERLKSAGITDIVINIAYLGDKIREALSDGSELGVSIVYSEEPEPLETAGAILFASELLGSDPFVLVNADIWCDFDLSQLLEQSLAEDELGHLIMVPNPDFKEVGDFELSLCDQRGYCKLQKCLHGGNTYSGIALLRPELVTQYPERRSVFPLVECLHWACEHFALTGEVFDGTWLDIGTPERLQQIETMLSEAD